MSYELTLNAGAGTFAHTTSAAYLTSAEPRTKARPQQASGTWPLILVNPEHRLERGYRAPLVTFAEGARIDRRILTQAQLMLIACHDAGLKPRVSSAWRSRASQALLFAKRAFALVLKGRTPTHAIELTQRFVAAPGTSEHELGLALDINAASSDPAEHAAIHAWLASNAWRYGFVCRYPAAKAHLTGIGSEPWHVRYVGKDAARAMHASGECLEEYVARMGEHC